MTIILVMMAYVSGAQSSVLAEGTWFKVGITESGMYRIDRSTLDALGVSAIGDPNHIQLFGNGVKGTLPQRNSVARPSDLVENSIFVSSGSDGSFDQEDYILFYGVGPHLEDWSNEGFDFKRNIYSDTAYYFLRFGYESGKRISLAPSLAGPAVASVSEFDDHITFEEDTRNLISSGRNWLGDIITSNEPYRSAIAIEGLTSEIQGYFLGVSQSSEVAKISILADNDPVGSFDLSAIRTGEGSIYSVKASEKSGTFTLPQRSPFELNVQYASGGTNARGLIDRYVLTFKRGLQRYEADTDFRVLGHQGQSVRYEITDPGDAKIWNITDPSNYFQQDFNLEGNVGNFISQSDQVEEFVIFEGADFPSPFVFSEVANQNLRGDVSIEGIIVSPAQFLAQAERLADFHRTMDGLSIKVVTPRMIYNEFSSGRQDVTAIRDYAKYAYEQGGNLKYLLLFGDCSYEYKYRLLDNTNFVPTYESRDSYDPIFSYSSDDYYAFFEEDEGEWAESFSGDHTMEIGVGRLPVKSEAEASVVVDKIIYYSTSENVLGTWKNEITYMADDGDGNVHSRHVEDLSEIIDTTYTQYSINKLLLDAFEQETNGAVDSSPEANQTLKSKIKDGTFVVNFIGHGNERLWTAEAVLTNEDIDEMNNRNKLPIFVTATCEFGRYDDPLQVSGAERLLLNNSGGAIALLTTSRPVFASTNFELNRAFHENVFKKVDGKPLRLGDIIRSTKNEGLAGPVNRNFTLLGDPMLLPAFPKLDIEVNDFELDTLSALDEVTISGSVQNDGVVQQDFNGMLAVVIYDVEQRLRTKGQESTPYTYTVRSNAIFRGEATVIDGQFSFSFIVPKNISYQYETGKMSLYAFDEENNIDAVGSSKSFFIGGTAPDAPIDNVAPSVTLFMNNESFESGGLVGKNALLIAKIEDESGITTSSSGIVQGIALELNDRFFNLNEFYTASPDNFREGSIVFPVQDLEVGSYTAMLTVWDTHNNSTTSTIEFIVSNENQFFVYNELVYPNPIRVDEEAIFQFEHDREDEDVAVSLLIYNARGDVVNSKAYLFENSDRSIEIPWIAATDSGSRLNEGIYYYRLIIKSNFDGATKEIAQKLVIRN